MSAAKVSVIVGGGVGGLTAAIALSRGGWEVHVCERSAEWRETGAGYNVSPEAVRCLHELGLGSRFDAALHLATPRRESAAHAW
ncbi:MAG: FAD-dependent monooxygenase [Polyangiaceae bacterium]